MPTLEDYKSPCRICFGYNPFTCNQCIRYSKKLLENSPGIDATIKEIEKVEKYWKQINKICENNGCYSWEDYEHD